jgi:hypothetical protein
MDTEDRSQQDRTIEQLKKAGWVVIQSDEPPQDGSILMQLTTPEGVSHIVVMLNGDRVDARQKLGKQPSKPNPGAP